MTCPCQRCGDEQPAPPRTVDAIYSLVVLSRSPEYEGTRPVTTDTADIKP